MTSTSAALKEVFAAAKPLVADWLDIAEQMAALRDAATAKGLDWSQVKALVKAQVQDERDENGDGKRVKRIVEKAEFASAYADMLGLANMNEENFSAEDEDELKSAFGSHDEPSSPLPGAKDGSEDATTGADAASSAPVETHDPETGEVFGEGIKTYSHRQTFDATGDYRAPDDPPVVVFGSFMPGVDFDHSPSPAPVSVPRGEEAGAVASVPVPASTFDAGDIPAFLDRRRNREAVA